MFAGVNTHTNSYGGLIYGVGGNIGPLTGTNMCTGHAQPDVARGAESRVAGPGFDDFDRLAEKEGGGRWDAFFDVSEFV